jgi:tetratricopeptide (TPR) repeat protein
VLVLDNAETPWWADAADAEQVFATLAAVPGLALVASLRGRQRPFGLAWRDPVDVAPLATPEARKVFLAVAGKSFENDPHLDLLVGAQDGLPLTTTLLAYQAEGEPNLEGLWNQWTERRLALLERGVGGTEVSVQASFDLSINSERMTDQARRLLSLLAVLPDGIAHDDLDTLLPGTGDEAATSLRRVGLAFDEGSRLRTLQPIRDHVQTAHAPRADDLAQAVAQYCALAEGLGWQLGQAGGARASSQLLAERGNLEAMLDLGLQEEDPTAAINAAVAYAEFMRYSGVGTTSLLEVAARAAGQLGDATLHGEALYRIGLVAYGRTEYDTAQARYQEAQPLYEQTGNLVGQANCIKGLGDIALNRDDNYDTAQARFEEAQSLYEQTGNLLGQANCIQSLGDVALQRADHGTAQARFEEALALYQQLRDLYSIGATHQRLARIAGTDAERHQHVQAAQAAWTSIGRTDLIEAVEDEFGED